MNPATQRMVFVTGATGHIGRTLIPLLVAGGHSVRTLVRPGSENRLPASCTPIAGDALRGESYADLVAPADTFVHLVGVSHPNPSKVQQFRDIDLKSTQEAAVAARRAGIQHFIYLSVAHPAPIMKAYIEARQQGEALLRASGMNATFLRPWYVLGPGRRWAAALLPFYRLFELIPTTRASALRLGLVTSGAMAQALRYAVENPVLGIRVMEVPQIRSFGRQAGR